MPRYRAVIERTERYEEVVEIEAPSFSDAVDATTTTVIHHDWTDNTLVEATVGLSLIERIKD